MCGFAGVLKKESTWTGYEDFNKILQKMGMIMAHRGPDDSGVWFDQAAGVGLAHRRLAVIDLTPNAKQPMESSCGRYIMAYNGEIYNFRCLRQELIEKNHNFKGNGDTETLLESISEWGGAEPGFAEMQRHVCLCLMG